MDGIVIAIGIADADFTVGIADIVLQLVGVAGEVTLGEVVYITPEFAAEQVFDRLIVTGACIVEIDTPLQREYVGDAVVEI